MKILMVSTEYPPMKGGVAHYSQKLVGSLRNEGLEVSVVCNEQGNGDFMGISPYNRHNPDVVIKAVKEFKPDVVHVQYEQGLDGLHLDPINPKRTGTTIESFYHDCKLPIVTTFHSAYTFTQWMRLVVPSSGRFGRIGTFLRAMYDYWTHLLNYSSFNTLNRGKIGPNRAGIVFSKYLQNLIPGSYLIYHGSEPSVPPPTDKSEVRKKFLLPEDANVALALGFMTATKGWDMIKKMRVPNDWKIVINTSKNHYSKEGVKKKFENDGVIDLNRGFLDDGELSLLLYSADALILPYRVSSGSGVMFDGFAHGLPFISSNIPFFREFSDIGLGISARRDPNQFSRALLALEQNLERYKNTVEIFSKKLLWQDIANKHIILYNLIVNNPNSSVLKKNMFSY
jgi:glycosyltransferase involved in cell wall biosynthesis